ncbi:EF-hand domain-containing protein [Duganella sp. BJB488]|uniref:EF-hand domain-containing protein n=1 Tax=unclassified Duganella TaxID=2636909 RepID=UPI000E34A076|nr:MULTISPECIES: EF-hand domain-containing protein [unclassified Duganella]NVD74083.1 EF-hand domain-containing protein [Duganella sp. BJB1802]RFP16944.1 EF-hand domain-containing protein [Duganella sp. BJB489]RFP20636.1 EF-hand domain-containing protein [Duganella sp. BJB488]RFP32310.1 EF-hand domain-containing protein [Duganella sp. BJB480]
MTTAISGVSSGSTQATTFDPAKGAARFAAKVFKDLDADKDGKVNKDEFVSGLESKGVSADDATKQFDAIDTQKTGSITQSDLETAIKSGSFAPPRPNGGGEAGGSGGPQGGQHAEGARGAGGGGGAGGVSSSGSSSKTYEAADTNKDGTVSAQEQLVYSIAHPDKTSDASKIGNNVDQLA